VQLGRTAVRKIGINHIDPLSLLGQNDQNLRLIEDRYPVNITLRDATLSVSGNQEKDVEKASQALRDLVSLVERGGVVEDADVHIALGTAGKNNKKNNSRNNADGNGAGDTPVYVFDRKTLRARSPNQAEYLRALEKHDIVFAIGPAGTGKTYLAVAAALHALRSHQVERIVLTRPAVEAGESLGYLPGDMQEKVDPYLRPLYDALQDFLPFEKIRRFMELGVIEIAPLAFMRGRTLHKSFVILDEAQNTTVRQMKMFLTRLGSNSKAAVTGDITQIDLENPDRSGLVQIQRILSSVPDISFVYFGPEDVVRHRLVRDILRAFQEFQQRETTEVSNSEGDSTDTAAKTPHKVGDSGNPDSRTTAE
jgi:phosphate starvation-inducible PhoH-like protein